MKKTALHHLINEEIENQLNENKSSILKGKIQAAIDEVDENLSYEDLAVAVAGIIMDSYGSHNISPFMKVLHSRLNLNESILHNYDTYIETTIGELDWDEHLEPISDYSGIYLPNPKDMSDPVLINNKATLMWYKNHVQDKPILVSTDPKDPAKHKVKYK